jgi:hypothetical protein
LHLINQKEVCLGQLKKDQGTQASVVLSGEPVRRLATEQAQVVLGLNKQFLKR